MCLGIASSGRCPVHLGVSQAHASFRVKRKQRNLFSVLSGQDYHTMAGLESFDFSRVDLEADLRLFAVAFVLLFVVDVLFSKAGWFADDRNGRYLSLHVLVNSYVTAVHLDDVYVFLFLCVWLSAAPVTLDLKSTFVRPTHERRGSTSPAQTKPLAWEPTFVRIANATFVGCCYCNGKIET